MLWSTENPVGVGASNSTVLNAYIGRRLAISDGLWWIIMMITITHIKPSKRSSEQIVVSHRWAGYVILGPPL